MGLTHCPLCMALAVLCAVRFSAHTVLVWQWRRLEPGLAGQRPLPRLHPQAI